LISVKLAALPAVRPVQDEHERAGHAAEMREMRDAWFTVAEPQREFEQGIAGCKKPGRHGNRWEQQNDGLFREKQRIGEQHAEYARGCANGRITGPGFQQRDRRLSECACYDAGEIQLGDSFPAVTMIPTLIALNLLGFV
jgi:hypothetical protein